jgi:beta-lactamase class A
MLALVCAVALAAPKLTDLKPKLDALCAAFHGRAGYCVRELKSGRTIDYRGDEIFPTASTMKTGVMVAAIQEVDEGKLTMGTVHPLPDKDNREASMWSFYLREGTKIDLDAYINLMITVSDNTALIGLRNWIGSLEVNRRMEALGLKNTKVLGGEPTLKELHDKWGLGMTTPKEMNELLYDIAQNKAASPAGCEKMLRILSHQYWDDSIGLSVPPTVRMASKSGAVNRSRSDTAIVFAGNPYILTVYTAEQVDQRWTPDNEGEVLVRKVAQMVWAFMEPKQPYSPPPGYIEKYIPTGGGIESD